MALLFLCEALARSFLWVCTPNSRRTILTNAVTLTPTYKARTPNALSPVLAFLLCSLISMCICFESENTVILAGRRNKSRIRMLLALNSMRATGRKGRLAPVSPQERLETHWQDTELHGHHWWGMSITITCMPGCRAQWPKPGKTEPPLAQRETNAEPLDAGTGVSLGTEALGAHCLNKALWLQVSGLSCFKELLRLRKLDPRTHINSRVEQN